MLPYESRMSVADNIVNLNAFSIGSESAERIKVLSKGFCTNSMASLKWLNEVKIQVEPELAYFSQV